MDGSILFARWRQSALPRGHIGATWWIRLNLCFSWLTQVHNPNGKSIGSAIFAQLMEECHRACSGMSFPLIIASSHGGSGPHLVYASLGPPESITQKASWSVRPFLHSSRQNVVGHGGACPSPSKLSLPMGICAHVTCGSLGPPDSVSKMASHSGRFCTAHGRQSLYFTMGTPFPKIAPSNGGSGCHLIHDTLGPCKPIIQMVSRLVQPFCTDDRSVRILSIGRPFPPQNCRFPWKDLNPI